MTDQEINEAIAEACGATWSKVLNPCCDSEASWQLAFREQKPGTHHLSLGMPWQVDFVVATEPTDNAKRTTNIPSYCQDLNAMHEAEKVLHDKQLAWTIQLVKATNGAWVNSCSLHYADVIAIAHATARQRAEAFLRTIGKWKE